MYKERFTLVRRSNRLALAFSPLPSASLCRLANSSCLCCNDSITDFGTGATTAKSDGDEQEENRTVTDMESKVRPL